MMYYDDLLVGQVVSRYVFGNATAMHGGFQRCAIRPREGCKERPSMTSRQIWTRWSISICYLSIFSYILIRWLNSITVSHGSLPIRPISLGFFLPLDTIELSKLWKQRSSPCRVLLVWRCCEMVTHTHRHTHTETHTHTTHRHTHTRHTDTQTHTQTRQHTKQNSQGGRYLVLFSKQPHHPKSTIGQG